MASIRLFFFLAFVFYIIMGMKEGHAQSLSCDASLSQPLCPGALVSCTCVVTGTAYNTRWTFPTTNPCSLQINFISLSQADPCVPPAPSSSGTCGSYLSAANNNPLVSGSSCNVSTLNITANPSLNGLVIECRDASGATLVGTRNVSIVIGPPGAPNVNMSKNIGPDMVLVVVNPSSSGGLPTSYNVTISNSSYVNTKSTPAGLNGFAMVTFTGVVLTNNTNYTISAVAINCAGSSISSNTTTILVSWPTPTTSPSPSPSLATNTASPTIATTQNSTTGPIVGIIVGVVVGVVVLLVVVLIVISIVIYFFLCKPSNGSKLNKIDGQDDQPHAQVKVELLEELVPARPPRQVPAEESHGKTQANRVPIEEALYDGNVGPGGMVTTGRGGYTQEAQYSTPDVSKKNADKQMYAEVQVSTAPKNTASSSKKGKGVLPPPSTQQDVLYSAVKT